jgi:subtilisin family serine protease
MSKGGMMNVTWGPRRRDLGVTVRVGIFVAAFIVLLASTLCGARYADARQPGPSPLAEHFLESAPRPAEASEGSGGDSVEALGQRVPGRYIVVLEDSVTQPAATARTQTESHGGKLRFVYRHALKGYSAELSPTAVRELRDAPNVKYVTPVLRVEGTGQSIPTGISRTFAGSNSALDIDEVDDARINVDVAVIDSGIDQSHPEVNVVAKTDCTIAFPCADGMGTDEAGHGTHVAGTIGAIDNGIGVVGMAPGARLWSVRVLNAQNGGTSEWIIAGVDWVTARASEIEVANMSLAGWGREPALEEAIGKAIDKGVVFVVAAGNATFQARAFWPANTPDVITTSAIADYDGKPGWLGSPTCVWMGDDDDHGWYSNWGGGVDIAAPGTCILSSVPGGGYASYYGTSMAAPHVTGAAAVLASKANPNNRTEVMALRKQLLDEATLDWTDTSEDNSYEPHLYAGGKPLTTPEVATGGVINTDGETVVVDGAVITHGVETEYKFEYGTTTSYGSVAPATPKKLSGSVGYTKVSEGIKGLEPDQTYHYRLAATSSAGTVYGDDRTFVPSRWIKDNPQRVSDFEWIYDTSCVPSGHCMAVGYAYFNEDNRQVSYLYQNGGWTYKELPIPANGWSPEPIGISCVSATSCVAAGHYFEGEDVKVLIERWNGTSWSPEAVPSPYAGAPFTRARSVSCVSSSECFAIGAFVDGNGVLKNWSGQLKGGSWTNVTVPSVEGAEESMLEDVSCTSATFCMAVGWAFDEGVGHKPVSAIWNGTAWKLVTAARASDKAISVSCTSSTFCMTVGAGLTSEVWNGEKWEIKEPAAAFYGRLASVACNSPTYCVAVGSAKALKYFGITEIWNGSTWVKLPPAMEGEEVHALYSVSCAGLAGCAAVGESKPSSSITGLFEHRVEVTTTAPSAVLPTKATVGGSVNPAGLATDYYFEYGLTTSYGGKAPAVGKGIGAGMTPVGVSEELVGLKPGSVYHYRVVATNTNARGEKVTVPGKDRTFKTPGLAFFADQYPVSLDSTANEGNHELVFPASIWGTISCASPPRLHAESVEGSSTALALDGYDGSCSNAQTLKMNGCKFIVNAGLGESTVDIGPAGCGPITISGSYCGFQFGAQTGLAADIENVTSKEGYEQLRLEIDATGIQYTTTGTATSCHKGTYSNGSYSGAWILGAVDSGVGTPVDMRVSSLAVVGRPNGTPQPRWEGGFYALPVTAQQSASDPLVFGFKDGYTVSCKAATGSGSLLEASKSLLLAGAYSECVSGNGTTTAIKMNSCAYELNVQNASPLHNAKVDVECTKAGDAIEVQAGSCRFKIGAQQSREVVGLNNSAAAGGVIADFGLKGISYEATDGFLCPLNGGGQFSNGTYDGTMTLSGG